MLKSFFAESFAQLAAQHTNRTCKPYAAIAAKKQSTQNNTSNIESNDAQINQQQLLELLQTVQTGQQAITTAFDHNQTRTFTATASGLSGIAAQKKLTIPIFQGKLGC